MKLLLVSFGDYDYDGRLRELISTFSMLGELHTYVRASTSKSKVTDAYNSDNYINFIKNSIKIAKKYRDIDVLILDNRKSILPGRIIKRIIKPKLTVLDCRELYFFNTVKHFAGKVGCIIEKPMIKKADIVICAGKERAEFMKEAYGLKKEPIVYENIRGLNFESKFDGESFIKKYDLNRNDEYRIVCSSGCEIFRMTDVIIKNINRVNAPCRLFLAGKSSAEDEQTIKSLIKQLNIDNVVITGRLNQSELKCLIQHSHIGIVNYCQADLNNKFCASGKIYEFLYEGIPIVTTTNPPLIKMCDTYNIGVSDDSFADGINTVIKNYEKYVADARRFAQTHTVADNNKKFSENLKSAISEEMMLH